MQKGTLMKRGSHMSATLLFFFLAISQVCASPITLPAGLNPGDQYRLAFVTNSTWEAFSPHIDWYNSQVLLTALAVPELAALNADWRAIASTIFVNAYVNTDTHLTESGVPIYNLAGQLIATGNQDLWDGSLLVSIEYTEEGTPSSAEFVWTGTTLHGSIGMPLGAFSEPATVGNPHFADRTWIDFMPRPIHELNALYGISAPLTAPVPLPSAILLFGSGLIGLIGFRRKFKK